MNKYNQLKLGTVIINSKSLDIKDKVLSLTAQLEAKIEKEFKEIGICAYCQKPINDIKNGCQALDKIYHTQCFTCNACGRILKNKSFYMVKEKIFCQEDYFYSGFQEATEKCSSCEHLIMDRVLHALGKSYHPGCFRCFICNKSLDGVPYTMGKDNKIYCYKDYHKMFSIKCHKCQKVITPNEQTGEIVRVIYFEKEFHVDCFKCDFCHRFLNNEGDNKYALYLHDRYLICVKCNRT